MPLHLEKTLFTYLYSNKFLLKSIYIILIFWTLFPISALARGGAVVIPMNTIQALPLPETVGSVLIGNPAIANVTLDNGRLLIVGLGVGQTNLLVASETGQTLMSRTIIVTAPTGNTVTVRKGGKPAQPYICTPRCEAPAADAPGDTLRRLAPPPRED